MTAQAETRDPHRFPPTLGDLDLHLLGEGRHRNLWRALGAHPRAHEGISGVSFAVWAPGARAVAVIGDFNRWDAEQHPLRSLGASGVWELFLPGLAAGAHYKFAILTTRGELRLKADPLAFAAELPPGTASIVSRSEHEWRDQQWMARRAGGDHLSRPLSIYEVHPGSWRRVPAEGNRPLTYLELAEQLPDHLEAMGFTHVELMAVAEHPFAGSWGYQVSSYYAPTSRFGTPDDLRFLIDACHQRDIGVIMDWVPAHFPRDEWALTCFDGTPLYEDRDPQLGVQHQWGTLRFDYGRNQVRNFLVANALYWVEEFHIDGIRVDGVSSMIYRDRLSGSNEWTPDQTGGEENREAVAFLRELNETVHATHPSVMMIAEESTTWPGVTRPAHAGGLDFALKWNMGWMHDTLAYFSVAPVRRNSHHHQLTLGLLYAFSENFVLPLSHDEVVHGKGSLLGRMPGDHPGKAASLRALLAWMWAHPGKKLLFMGGEIAQPGEWDHDGSVAWDLLDQPEHRGVHTLVRELNTLYRAEPALWERDMTPDGFSWIDVHAQESTVLSFLRFSRDRGRALACVANLSPLPRIGHRLGLPAAGAWRSILSTDAPRFGGGGPDRAGVVLADGDQWQGFPHSAGLDLAPCTVTWLTPGEQGA